MHIVGAVLLSAVTGSGELAEEFYHDFRRGLANQPALRLIGPNAQAAVKQEGQGLRITLPAKRPKVDPVGLSPKFQVHGDFEITVTYELVEAEEPAKGYGVGARLWIKLDAPAFEACSLGRLTRAKGGQKFLAYHVKKDDEGKEKSWSKEMAAEAKTGKLRLARQGKTLLFLVADGNSQDFREVYRVETGTDDLSGITLSATSGGEPRKVDVRFLDLRIRSEKLPTPGSPSSNGWWIWVLAAVTVLLAAGLWYRRRRRRTADVSA